MPQLDETSKLLLAFMSAYDLSYEDVLWSLESIAACKQIEAAIAGNLDSADRWMQVAGLLDVALCSPDSVQN